MTLVEKQRQLIADYAVIENPQERLAAIVDRARRVPPLPAADRTESNRVPGCISAAWLVAGVRDGRCHFQTDADSPLVRGLLHLLGELYSGATPAEVAAVEPELFPALGLDQQLSPTRRNGLQSFRTRLRDFAAAHTGGKPGDARSLP